VEEIKGEKRSANEVRDVQRMVYARCLWVLVGGDWRLGRSREVHALSPFS